MRIIPNMQAILSTEEMMYVHRQRQSEADLVLAQLLERLKVGERLQQENTTFRLLLEKAYARIPLQGNEQLKINISAALESVSELD